MYRIIIGLLSCYLVTSHAQDIEVIAFEYPPYLTQHSTDQGEAVALLQHAFAYSAFSPKIRFINNRDAQQYVNNRKWCLSFIPPQSPTKQHLQVILADNTLPLTLFRLAEPQVFIGNELKDKVIAHLPISLGDNKVRAFVDSGAQLAPVDTIEQGISLLLNQEVDYVYGDQQAIDFASKKLNFPAMLLQDSATVFYHFPISVWLNTQCQNAQQLRDHFTQQRYSIYHF